MTAGTSRILSPPGRATSGHSRRNCSSAIAKRPSPLSATGCGRNTGVLGALNTAWTRRYPNWEAIDPPRYLGTYADWVDWRRFMMERSTREMRFRVETARAADPVHVMESHAAHHPPVDGCVTTGTNAWRLAEELDAWGMSLFPRWQFPEIYHGAAEV